MIEHFIFMSVALENIMNNFWGASFDPYTDPLNPFPMVFFSLIFIVAPTLVVANKTDHPIPPLMVLIMSSILVSELVGQFGWIFKIIAGIFAGITFYLIATGAVR